jgi:Tfp pilus assembly protein PilF
MLKTNLTLLALLPLVLLVSACSNPSIKKINTRIDEVLVQMKPDEPAEKTPPAQPAPAAAPRKSEQNLNLGVKNYEDGKYQEAAGYFQNALGDNSLTLGEQVTAHKFLAFIYCVSGEKLACRGEFKKVLALNPKFELSAGEAGHPIWGAVFREVQTEAAARKNRKN